MKNFLCCLTFSSGKHLLSVRNYSTFNLNEMTESECLSEFRFRKRHSDVIAVFLIKFISSILEINDLPYLKRTNKFITYEFARSASTTVVILRSKNQFISRIFNQHRLLEEKKERYLDLRGLENAKACKNL